MQAPLPSVDCGDGKKCWRVEDFIYDFAVRAATPGLHYSK